MITKERSTNTCHLLSCNTLSYRLPPSVQIHDNEGGLSLVLSYPLKFIHLNTTWKPVLSCLATRDFVSLESILVLLPQLEPLTVELFLAKLVRRGFLEQRGIIPQKVYPTVSIIIPVRNRPQDIRACLLSLQKLNYPSEKVEIIVVDDCSSDTTPEVIGEFPVTLLRMEQHRQASFCRNSAARYAKNEILAFIDSDCEADPDWLLALTPAFREDCVAAVGGKIDSYYSTGQLDRYEKAQSSLMVASCYKRSDESEPFFYVPSCNFLVRRECFLSLNGFNNDMHVGEDVDLCWRLQNSGFRVDYRPVGTIYHKHRNRLFSFCSRRFDYGTSEPQLQKVHQDRRKKMVFPPFPTIFWFAIAVFALSGNIFFAPLAFSIPLVGALFLCRKVRASQVPLGYMKILAAVLRSYGAWMYHLCEFFSRYYLLFTPLLFMVMPLLFWLMGLMHLLTCIGQYIIKKPRLSIIAFFFYFSLEQLSYQIGVWWNCVKSGYFGSIFPRATFFRQAHIIR